MDLSHLSDLNLDDDRLQVGSIFYSMVSETNPPKKKYYIIIGITDDTIGVGVVYINSEININVLRTEKLRNLQWQIKKTDYPFLDYDSYVDCSSIQEYSKSYLEEFLKNGNPFCNSLIPEHLDVIVQNLKYADSISPYQKKRFRLDMK